MKSATLKSNSQREQLEHSSIASHTLFPGRTTLYVAEVARALTMTIQQVVDLIRGRQLLAIDISSGLKSRNNPRGNKTARSYWRIPVSAFDDFITKRANL